LNRETADAGKPRFKFKRIRDGEYGWIATSGYENAGRYRGFTAAGKALADVKRFAKIVRWCERTDKMEDLSWLCRWRKRPAFRRCGAGLSAPSKVNRQSLVISARIPIYIHTKDKI
jgi:hypothetical protein